MPFQSSQTPGTKGLFQDNTWYCDCDPRLPAVYLQVKKKNHNHGRWFYTCQKGPGRKSGRCRFFLWADESEAREKGQLLSPPNLLPSAPNTPARPAPTTATSPPVPTTVSPAPGRPKRQTIFKGIPMPGPLNDGDASSDDDLFVANEPLAADDDRFVAHAPPDRSSWSQGPSAALGRGNGNKRKRGAVAEEEGFGFDEVGSEAERALLVAADAGQERDRRNGSSQRGSSQRSSNNQSAAGAPPRTPTARRVAGPGGATPVSRNRLLTVAEERERKRVRFNGDGDEGGEEEAVVDVKQEDLDEDDWLPPLLASTPSKATARPQPAPGDDQDVAGAVIALLPPSLPPSTRAAVRRELNRYAARVAHEATARVAELQARVVSLEEERRMDRERTKKLKALLAEMLVRDG